MADTLNPSVPPTRPGLHAGTVIQYYRGDGGARSILRVVCMYYIPHYTSELQKGIMRQVSIRTLRSGLSTQLMDLPFEVTRNGKIIGIMCTQDDFQGYIEDDIKVKQVKSVHNPVKAVKKQLTNIVKKKQKYIHPASTSHTGWINPLTNTALAPKGGE